MNHTKSTCRAWLVRTFALVFCPAAFACLQLFSNKSAVASSGPTKMAALQQPPSEGGRWWPQGVIWPVVPVHISLLPNSKVLLWTRDKTPAGKNTVGYSKAYIWNPNSPPISPATPIPEPESSKNKNPELSAVGPYMTAVPNNTTNLFCTGHSFLPDGRLMVTGSGDPALFGHKDVDIFVPPYHYNADGTVKPRPTITSAPPSVSYGRSFFVQTPQAATITKVSLIRLPSVTHTFNQDQQIIFLDPIIAPGGGGINLVAPTNSNICPPGHYLLFILRAYL
jgi:hypothetical protein